MYSFSWIDQGIVCARHEGPVTVDDSRQFRAFLKEHRGQLLIDMRGTPSCDVMAELLRVRPMLPQTACVGTLEHRLICDELPGKDFYMHEMRHFPTEVEALAWLRGEESGVESDEEAAVAA